MEVNGKGFGKDGSEARFKIKMGSDSYDCPNICYLKECGPTQVFCRTPALVDGSAELEVREKFFTV